MQRGSDGKRELTSREVRADERRGLDATIEFARQAMSSGRSQVYYKFTIGFTIGFTKRGAKGLENLGLSFMTKKVYVFFGGRFEGLSQGIE